jgi:hypothetical protein
MTTLVVILRAECAAEQRRSFERKEEIATYKLPGDVFGSGVSHHLKRRVTQSDDLGERFVAMLKGAE